MPKNKNNTISCAHKALAKELSPSLVDIIEGTDLPIKRFCNNRYKLVRNLLKKYNLTPSKYRKLFQEKDGYIQIKLIPKRESNGRSKYGSSLERFFINRFSGSAYLNDEH